MKRSRFTETQIISILSEADAGMQIKELCRKHGISDATYYNWKSKYGGMSASELKRLREIEQENAKLKRMYADLAAAKDLLEGYNFADASLRLKCVEATINELHFSCPNTWHCGAANSRLARFRALPGYSSPRPGGRVVMLRPAKPSTPVRFRPWPPIQLPIASMKAPET